MKERCVETPGFPTWVTSTANAIDTTAVPPNFCAFVSPSERCRRTFMKSSRNPTTPKPTVANTSATPVTVNRWAVTRDAR